MYSVSLDVIGSPEQVVVKAKLECARLLGDRGSETVGSESSGIHSQLDETNVL
jgi:hypothetical protein